VAAAKAAAAKAAALKAEAERKAAEDGGKPPSETGAIPGGVGTLVEGLPRVRLITPHRGDDPETGVTFVPPTRLGGPRPAERGNGLVQAPSGPGATPTVPKPAPDYRRQQFLREAHMTACRRFNTVLGPEANNAHRNHLHVDMAERTSGAFCE
jgi:hypothetical protein